MSRTALSLGAIWHSRQSAHPVKARAGLQKRHYRAVPAKTHLGTGAGKGDTTRLEGGVSGEMHKHTGKLVSSPSSWEGSLHSFYKSLLT